MKKHLTAVLTIVMLVFLVGAPIYSFAGSLDDVISEQESSSDDGNTSEQPQPTQSTSNSVDTDQYIKEISEASRIEVDFKGASTAQAAIKKVAGTIISVLSYFLVAFMAVRVVVDLVYITLPFTRSILANGYGGNAAAGGGGMGMQQPGMGMGGMGMGMGGMGMGGMGMNRMGMGGMGMNRMGMGMGGMQGGSQMGATPAMGRLQWVSNAALNAVASESMPGPDGKPQSALKYYAKDMTIMLVITPILLTLAVTGVLVDLGFLLGELIGRGITSFSNSL